MTKSIQQMTNPELLTWAAVTTVKGVAVYFVGKFAWNLMLDIATFSFSKK